MSLSKKKLRSVDDAIRSVSLSVMDEFFPDWSKTPPDQMDDHQKALFDALTEFERLATQKVREVLS